MRILFDIETNGLLDDLDRVWCAAACYPDDPDGLERCWAPAGLDDLCDALFVATELIGHNIARFDLPALKKVYGWEPRPEVKIIDTAVISALMYPDIKPIKWPKKDGPGFSFGFHSLRAWGERLEVLKGDYGETTDWQSYTPAMLDYCVQDVRVNLALLKHLEEAA